MELYVDVFQLHELKAVHSRTVFPSEETVLIYTSGRGVVFTLERPKITYFP